MSAQNRSGAVMTMGPTLVNVDRLTTEELKDELYRAQGEALRAGLALHDMNVVAHRQAEVILGLVTAHEAGDKAGVESALQRLSDWQADQAKARSKPN